MYRSSRQSGRPLLPLILLFFIWAAPLWAENWRGPVKLEPFDFDRMSLYAIGWTPGGGFAFGTVTAGEGSRRFWQWSVLDLVEDKILYTSPEALLLEGQSPAQIWELHPEWHSQLIRFHIKTESVFKAGGQIFRQDGDSYRMSYSMDRSESEEYPGGYTKSIHIDLFRNGNTAKTVYSYSPEPEQPAVEDLILKGHILSPHEKRCALVTLEKTANSGEPARWRYRIIGAHLTVGFSSVKQAGGALVEAVFNGQYYVSRMLLEQGADPAAPDPRGYPPLLIAARLGNWDILNLLAEAGVYKDIHVNVRDDRGRTALHYAVEAEKADAVRLLLNAGSNPDTKDGEGQSPRLLAGLEGNPDITSLF